VSGSVFVFAKDLVLAFAARALPLTLNIEAGVSVRLMGGMDVGGLVLPPLTAPNFGVISPLLPDPFTMPRPGIIGVLSELVDALPLEPNGNFVSKAPDREFDEVLGRLVADEAPKDPHPLP